MKKMMKRGLALLLTLIMIIGMVPSFTLPVTAVSASTTVDVDPGTAAQWEQIMGTSVDGARYAGRVWVDKSVYKDGQEVTLNHRDAAESSFTVDVDQANGEYFQVIFSALGSSMSTNTTIKDSHPMDVVLILDNSSSMNTPVSGRTTRMQYLIEAANDMLSDLLDGNDIRLGIVAYGQNASAVLPFGTYNNGVRLGVNSYTGSNSSSGIIRAYDKNGELINANYRSSGYANYTNTQAGVEMGMQMLATATNTANRKPVVILLTDGAANTARDRMFVSGQDGTVRQVYHASNIDPMIALSTLLGAAYNKALVKQHYGTAPIVYGIGVDLSERDGSNAIIDPAENFNGNNVNSNIRTAYETYTDIWVKGNNVNVNSGGYNFRFEHAYPQGSGVTDSNIAANINYVDKYQAVDGANLGDAFDSIYEELINSAFNPITSTQQGVTGVKDTPLIYADNIGKYMEVKNIQALQVFGHTYPVTKNANGTYSVAAGSGINPTTGERWDTNDIEIKVNENTDGTQQLRVYLDQEILPILLDKITVTTENNVTNRTLEALEYPPLRLYYTVGIDKSVLLPNGQVDITKIDSDYAYVDSTNGTISFYANAFGENNIEDRDGDGLVELGDAHVGFVPSHNNRFYYYQAHQEVFISATNMDGSPIVWEAGEYGVKWDPTKYKVKAMSYADYANIADSTQVYTYITFNRPTGSGNAAEEVTYLIYATWGDLKESVTFFDKVNNTSINGGSAIDVNSVNSTVSAYKQGKSIADTDLITILGLQSRRVSRLHNMYKYKTDNDTESAELAYAPAYNKGAHDEGDVHEHSEVIVWLGNNGRLTLPVGTGLQVTKNVTEVADGAAADEKFVIRVLLDMAYSDDAVRALTFVDGEGNPLNSSDYAVQDSDGKILVTFNLANGKSAYILGLTGGVNYTVTEEPHDQYSYTYTGANQTVTGTITEGVVTNAPKGYGNLTIVKDIDGVPENMSATMAAAMAAKVFTFKVDLGADFANEEFSVDAVNAPENILTDGKIAADAQGVITVKLKDNESLTILGIPEGTSYTVTEDAIPAGYVIASPANGVQSGTIERDGDQQAHFINHYNPAEISVPVDFTIHKELAGSTYTDEEDFKFQVQMLNSQGEYADVGEAILIANSAGPMRVNFARTREFTQIGTYHFRIVEVAGATNGMTYSPMRAMFAVVVTDKDADGVLEAQVISEGNTSVSDNDVSATFTNTYQVGSTYVDIDIYKDLVNETGIEISKTNFHFGLYEQDGLAPVYTVTSGEQGYAEIRIPVLDVNQNGKTYILREIIPDEGNKIPGMTYSSEEYTIVLNVTDNNGQLEATYTVNGTAETTNADDDVEATFENTYALTSASYDLTAKKLLNNAAPGDKTFTFGLHQTGSSFVHDASTIKETQENSADGSVVFDTLHFPKAGYYYYIVAEQAGTNPGMTYDTTHYHVTFTVGIDPENATALKVTNVAVNKVGTNSDATGDIVFTNTYAVTDMEDVVIDGIKILEVLSGSKALKAGDYTFGLFDAQGNLLVDSQGNAYTTTNLANGTFQFPAITFDGDDVGKSYEYTVKEIAPNDATDGFSDGVRYSDKVFTVTVNVLDNGDGSLRTEVTGNGRENIKFVNTYETKPVSVTIPGKKNLEGRNLTDGEFKFALYQTNLNFEDPVLIDDTITHDANGDFMLNLGTWGEGEHYFVVKEVIPEPHAPGIHYYTGEYRIIVNVIDIGKGQTSYTYTVVKDGNTNVPIVFSNIYRPEDQQLVIEGTKNYEGGKALTDEVFQVGLYDEAGELLHTAYVKADGSFTFDPVSYSYEDVGETFTYTVKEIIPDGATDNGDGTYTSGSNIYDGTVYTVTVTVEDNGGVLKITKKVTKGGAAAELSFTNTFIPNPIQHTLQATKTYEKGLKGNDFQFHLVSADGKTNVDQTKKNEANGNVNFDPITFPAAGDYKFTITEKKDGIFSFIRPSEAVYEVTVTVVNEKGVLKVSNVAVVNTKDTGESNLNFVNTYVMEGEDEVILRGTKTLTGDRTAVEKGEFTFGLYNADGELVESVKNDANGNFVFTALKFTEKDVAMDGQIVATYTVKEIAGTNPLVIYDDTVYTVKITVKDDDKGGVEANYTISSDANGKDTDAIALEFINIYKEPVNPATGDNFPVVALGSLLVVSCAAIVILMRNNKKKGGKYVA